MSTLKANHGPYRAISKAEYVALGGDGNPKCDWHEGIGFVVYDEKAAENFRLSVLAKKGGEA